MTPLSSAPSPFIHRQPPNHHPSHPIEGVSEPCCLFKFRYKAGSVKNLLQQQQRRRRRRRHFNWKTSFVGEKVFWIRLVLFRSCPIIVVVVVVMWRCYLASRDDVDLCVTLNVTLLQYLPAYFILFFNSFCSLSIFCFTIHMTNLTDKNSIKSNRPNRIMKIIDVVFGVQ